MVVVENSPASAGGNGPAAMTNERTFQYKLVLLGESAVGKSSLVLRFVKNVFSTSQESTIGGKHFEIFILLHLLICFYFLSGLFDTNSSCGWRHDEIWNLGYCRTGTIPFLGSNVLSRRKCGDHRLRHNLAGLFWTGQEMDHGAGKTGPAGHCNYTRWQQDWLANTATSRKGPGHKLPPGETKHSLLWSFSQDGWQCRRDIRQYIPKVTQDRGSSSYNGPCIHHFWLATNRLVQFLRSFRIKKQFLLLRCEKPQNKQMKNNKLKLIFSYHPFLKLLGSNMNQSVDNFVSQLKRR